MKQYQAEIQKPAHKIADLPFGGSNPAGESVAATSRYLTRNGKPWLPVMGEFHFSRYDRGSWETELLKMKAGGVEIIATYIFWIHHEEEKGCWDFTGSRCLRDFIRLCQKHGLLMMLRIGPWVHGESRNGGFPDWLVQDTTMELRSPDPKYMACVRELYAHIGEQAAGLMWKDGGPVVGVQIENEYWCPEPEKRAAGRVYMAELKKMAQEFGLVTPLYTATCWANAIVVDGEMLPVSGGYVDAPWEQHLNELPENPNFLMQTAANDPLIGSDLKISAAEHNDCYNAEDYPFFTAELGGGMQPTMHRRVVAFPKDTEALALCKLGSGATLLGYYVYHGGTNPDGRLSTLQESRATGYPNDCPVKSYDFEAPLREAGQAGESFGRLKKIHLFLQQWGDLVAPAQAVIPEDGCLKPADTQTLRYSVRHNFEENCGFVFVSNHLRKRTMPEQKDVCITVKTDDQVFSLVPFTLKDGETAILPYNLRLGDALLESTNATPLTAIGSRYFFYTDEEPVYRFADKAAEIVTLSRAQAQQAYRFGSKLYLTDGVLYEKEGEVWAEITADTEVTVYAETGEPCSFTLRAPSCSAVAAWEQTGEGRYTLRLACGSECSDCRMTVEYAGDQARLYQGDKLISDWFTTGLDYTVALRQFGYPEELTLELTPSDPNRYFDLPQPEGCSLTGVRMTPVFRIPLPVQQ